MKPTAAALLALLGFVLAAPPASAAEFGIAGFEVKMLDAEGQPESRAGSHPDLLQLDFALNVDETGTTARDFAIELPPGVGGSPTAVPPCSRELFEQGEECPAESQVGTIALGSSGGEIELPIFQLEPAPGEVMAFASLPGFEVPFAFEIRPDDYGITFSVSDLPKLPLSKGSFELWGVPADHQEGTAIPRRPLLTAPTRCGPFVATLRTRSWQEDAPWLSASDDSGAPLSGCESLAFGPELDFQLTNPVADAPTGARTQLDLEESHDPDGLANAMVRNVTVEMPEGVTVSPGGASKLAACSDAELGLGSTSEAHCPAASRVGAVEFASPSMPEPLAGAVYVGQERPGERFRLFVVAPGPGISVKFVGALQADPLTGRISARLEDLPQVPIERLTLSIDGGPRALLASPLACGDFAAAAHLEPYGGGAPVDSLASLTIGANPGGPPCANPPPFSPTLNVSSSRWAAGRTTAVEMSLLRRAGEQLPERFTIRLPKGLSAALGEVGVCPDSAARSGACPAASRMGSARAEVGSGSSLVALSGDVYLAGAYREAPFSTVIAFDGSIGPFDLGTMAVRAALEIQRRSGRVALVTDSLPTVIEGVPVRFNAIRMSLDRPGVVRNPTSCRPAAFDAVIESAGGAAVRRQGRLEVRRCDRLGFKPRLSLSLAGRSQLRERGRPQLRIAAHLRPGDTNLAAMHVWLPPALGFNVSGLDEICPLPDAVDGLCSPKSRVGSATVRSPVLDRVLRGSVYVVQPADDGPPDLWVGVSAMGLRMELRGSTAVRDGRFVTKLAGLPDMPLSAFTMRLRGGERGVLSLGAPPCSRSGMRQLTTRLQLRGQNGRRRSLRVRAKARCRGRASSE